MAHPSITGTYRLTRRELPDGTVQHYPDVRGMMSFSREFRSFSIVWRDEEGRFYSECYVARYELTDTEYSETSDYLMVDDQIGGKSIRYELEPTTASKPVTVEDDRISFDLPQQFERQLGIRVQFKDGKMTAISEGQFVDYWHKVA